jgi:hypothetical protein
MSLRERLHAEADGAWRSTRAVPSLWPAADDVDERLLRATERGAFWDTLADAGVTLLVTREYEHLLLALHASRGGPVVSYLPLPHPSGIAFDRRRGIVHVASTRNPNQVHDLVPAVAAPPDVGARPIRLPDRPLVPVRTPAPARRHVPARPGTRRRRAARQRRRQERDRSPRRRRRRDARVVAARGRAPRRRAARSELSAAQLDRRRPDDPRVVLFGVGRRDREAPARRRRLPGRPPRRRLLGPTREPIARGLTRPHSARLRRDQIWVDNSGYGEVGICRDGKLEVVARPGGWTRGLGFAGGVAFVGTSRVLTRFKQYAPGLDPDRCVCGVHAIEIKSGKVLGSLIWPNGNQVFAIEPVPAAWSAGLPAVAGRRRPEWERGLFYGFVTE